MKKYDEMQTELIVDTIFELYPDGMYFDEFVEFAEEVSCEFVYCIYDSFYHFIPCVQNFLVMRANYIALLKSNLTGNKTGYQEPTQTTLKPPLSEKLVDKVTRYGRSNTKLKKVEQLIQRALQDERHCTCFVPQASHLGLQMRVPRNVERRNSYAYLLGSGPP